jgi:CBS domain containing-hemolysin-like protein
VSVDLANCASRINSTNLSPFADRQVGGETLNEDEVTIISSVLELAEKRVEDIMTSLEDTYMLSGDTILDQDTVDQVRRCSFLSRRPVLSDLSLTDPGAGALEDPCTHARKRQGLYGNAK